MIYLYESNFYTTKENFNSKIDKLNGIETEINSINE